MKIIQNPTIAIIDSGIGGLSVLNNLINKFNAGNYIYYADNELMPYGDRSLEEIRTRVESLIDMLKKEYMVDLIIIACNTASSSINNVIDGVITIPFNGDYTYLATPLTKRNLKDKTVIADKFLATLIEKHIMSPHKLEYIIAKRAKRHKLNMLENLTLGCTHYELVAHIFEKYCPNTQIFRNSLNIFTSMPYVKYLGNELNIKVILSKNDQSYYDKVRHTIFSYFSRPH